MTLHGYDVSDYQATSTLATASACDFGIIKATEGTGFIAKTHATHAAAARKRGILVGHYHFAHADGDAAAQADFFVATAGALPGEVLVLDFEPYGQNVSASRYGAWVAAFARRVQAKTGALPWLYVDGNLITQVTSSASATDLALIHQMPLWKATYASNAGSLGGWSHLTAWQYTDKPLDQDYFYGDAAAWRALGVPSPVAAITAAQLTRLGAVLKAPAGHVIQALQAHLNAVDKPTPPLDVDGIAGPLTTTALQKRLNELGAHLILDGQYGPLTSAALDAQLTKGTI